MKQNKTIQVKAALLALVFSLNTLLGFACSLGFDMGYNKHHHEEEKVESSAKQHSHHAEPVAHHHSKQPTKSSKDDCCSNGVTSFNLLNKTVPQTFSLVHPVFSNAILAVFFQVNLFPHNDIHKNISVFALSHHPPIPDIRIAIQSFLI